MSNEHDYGAKLLEQIEATWKDHPNETRESIAVSVLIVALARTMEMVDKLEARVGALEALSHTHGYGY